MEEVIDNDHQSDFDPSARVFQAQMNKIEALKKECAKIVVGQDELIEKIIICLISEGHVLLEGVPGVAKTLAAKVFAKTIEAGFSRIQFTPDLMPADILGTTIFDKRDASFSFKKGPIFSNVILIDEINRAPAKTQSALFEVMEERQITMDGEKYPLTDPFMVIATQNPIEQEGTYRLPEAQLDRFMMKIQVSYPSFEEELAIMNRFKDKVGKISLETVQGILSPADLEDIKETAKKVAIDQQQIEYILEMVTATRNNPHLYLGASPRASRAILQSSKSAALIKGRDFVVPDDIQYVAQDILSHRVILSPDSEMTGMTTREVIQTIIRNTEVPR